MRRRLLGILSLGGILFLSGGTPVINRLSLPPHLQGLAPADSARLVKELRHNIVFDRLDLDSRRDLAFLLGMSPDIEQRREAIEVLTEAIEIDGSDPGLWAQLGRLQDRRGFRRESRNAYQRALTMAPDRADLWNELAHIEFRRFQGRRDDTYFQRAILANNRSLAVDPENREAIRRALRMAFLVGDLRACDSLCTRWSDILPADPWPILIRGMLQAEAGGWDLAAVSFQEGISGLDAVERKPFFRLDMIGRREEDARRAAPDTLGFYRDYWRWRDPTPSDALNPRLVEHYRRMVQAELLFSLDDFGLPGWEHAPGEMIVRYGLPHGWSYARDVIRIDEYRVSRAGLAVPSIRVRYGQTGDPHLFTFVDYNLSGRYYLPIEAYPTDEDYFLVANPALHEELLGVPELDQDVEVWRFVDETGAGRLEVGVALDPQVWPQDILGATYRIASKLTLYDADWQVRDASVGSWAVFRKDPLGRLVGRFELSASADSLILGIDTEDREKSGHAGDYRTLSARPAGPSPTLSDIAFLSEVDFESGSGQYGRGLGSGLPNPGHRYRVNDPVGVAFEAYGLARDPDGKFRARLRVTIARETRTGLFNVLLRRGQSPPEAELVFDVSEPGARLDQLLSLEVPPLETGNYVLRIQVEDLVAGRRVDRSETFTVEERRARR